MHPDSLSNKLSEDKEYKLICRIMKMDLVTKRKIGLS